MSRYVSAKMMRPVVIELRIVDCGLRIGATVPGPLNPHSAIRNPQPSYLPIREQDPLGGMRLRVALVAHPEIGPAHAIAAGHQPAKRGVEARLAADGDPADPGARRRGFGRRDARVEGDRKSTRLNSSHVEISYAVFCLKKKK